jgi:hypothetical protein
VVLGGKKTFLASELGGNLRYPGAAKWGFHFQINKKESRISPVIHAFGW